MSIKKIVFYFQIKLTLAISFEGWDNVDSMATAG